MPSDAKKALAKIIYFGKPCADIPFLWGLSREAHLAFASALSSAEWQRLEARFADRPNPKATRLSYALSAMEDDLLRALCQSAEACDGARATVYLFDGALVEVGAARAMGARAALERAALAHRVQLSTAPPAPQA